MSQLGLLLLETTQPCWKQNDIIIYLIMCNFGIDTKIIYNIDSIASNACSMSQLMLQTDLLETQRQHYLYNYLQLMYVFSGTDTKIIYNLDCIASSACHCFSC